MHTCSRAPMIGRRIAYNGYRTAKRAERDQFIADKFAELPAAHEAIARSAITPPEPRMYEDCAIEWGTEIDWDDWYAHYDDWDVDPFPWDSYEDLLANIEDEDEDEDTIEGREPLDTDDLPGWGTHLDFEDLAGLTITNRPYGFSGYGQRDR